MTMDFFTKAFLLTIPFGMIGSILIGMFAPNLKFWHSLLCYVPLLIVYIAWVFYS